MSMRQNCMYDHVDTSNLQSELYYLCSGVFDLLYDLPLLGDLERLLLKTKLHYKLVSLFGETCPGCPH